VRRPRTLLGLAPLATPIVCVVVLAWGWWTLTLPKGAPPPIAYVDVDGREIASLESRSGRVQIWIPLAQMPPAVPAAVIAAEDRRFMRHHGVDPLARTRSSGAPARSRNSSRAACS
jgi:membrane peptidoglycan carboxypeptidase